MHREHCSFFNAPLPMYRERCQHSVLSVEGVLKWLEEGESNIPYSKGQYQEDEVKDSSHISWLHLR
jgi:hypothetical protein